MVKEYSIAVRLNEEQKRFLNDLEKIRKKLKNDPPQDFEECKEILKELLRCADDYNPSREDEIDRLADYSLMKLLNAIRGGNKNVKI